jgi:hypothetical protein
MGIIGHSSRKNRITILYNACLLAPCPSAIGFASGECRAGSHGRRVGEVASLFFS